MSMGEDRPRPGAPREGGMLSPVPRWFLQVRGFPDARGRSAQTSWARCLWGPLQLAVTLLRPGAPPCPQGSLRGAPPGL